MTIIEKLIYALNNIENQYNVGPEGESSYELLSELGQKTLENQCIDHLEEQGYCAEGLWSVPDVKSRTDKEVTHEDAMAILHKATQGDFAMGVIWESIEQQVQDL